MFIWILLAALTLRLLFARSRFTDFDTYGHLYFAYELRPQSGGNPFKGIHTRVKAPEGIATSTFNDPLLWNYFIAQIFDCRKLVRWQHLINPTIDALAVTIFAISAYYVEFSEMVVLSAVALYLLSPAMFSNLTSGPRLRSLSPRLSSEIVTTLFFLTTHVARQHANPILYILAFLLLFYVFGSSKFGQQVVVFFVPLFSLFTQNPIPLLLLLLVFLINFVINPKAFLLFAAQRWEHLSWYSRQVREGRSMIQYRSSFQSYLQTIRQHGPLHILLSAHKHPLVYAGLFFPVVFVFLFSYVMQLGNLNQYTDLYAIGIIAVIAFILTSTRFFLHLGEAERYLNHVGFIIILCTANYLINHSLSWVLYLLLTYGAAIWLLELILVSESLKRLLKRAFKQEATPADINRVIENQARMIIDWLNGLANQETILCYPYHAVGAWRIMLMTPHYVVFPLTRGAEFMRYFNQHYGETYPYVDLNQIPKMVSDLGMNIIVARRADISKYIQSNSYFLRQWKELTLLELSYYVVYIRTADK